MACSHLEELGQLPAGSRSSMPSIWRGAGSLAG